MARYADFRYGSRLYGNTPKAVSRSFILAQAIDYGKVLLTLEVENRIGSGYVVTRTRAGSAEDPSNGIIVGSGTVAASTFALIDGVDTLTDEDARNDVSVPSGTVYYTLFIFDSAGTWFKDAATSVIVPKDKNAMQLFASILPHSYLSEDANPFSARRSDSDLYRFLSGFAVTFDELSTAIDLVLPSYTRGRGTVRRLHDAYAASVGMPIEYTIGVAASSRLYRDAGLIYGSKGTLAGVQKYAEALTNWNTVVSESPNKFLSLDDASFETGVGNWGVSGGTLEKAAVNGGSVTAPEMEFEDPISTFAAQGVGRLTTTSTTATITLPADSARAKCVPIIGLTTYYWKIPMRAVTGSPTVTPIIRWLDQSGIEVTSTTLTPESPTTNWTIAANSVAAPDDTYFAVLEIEVAGSVSDVVDFDMMSFCGSDTDYRDPRSVDVICGPARLNLLSDPSFESSGFWTADTGTFSQTTDESFLGAKSGKCEGTYRVTSEIIPELPNYPLTLSGYSKGTGTGNYVFEFLDTDDTVLSSQTVEAPVDTDWQRVDATIMPDSTATKFRLVLEGEGPVYFDAISLERADRPLVYFDGATSDQSGEDAKYADVDGHIYSLLYPNRLVKLIRLRQTLSFYLPLGVTARVLLWDSPDPRVKELLPYGV